MKKYTIIIFIIFVNYWPASSQDWQTVRNDSVRIFFLSGNSSLADDILYNTDQILQELTSLFKLSFSGEMNIFLAKNKDVWQKLTQEKIPDWSQGVTKSGSGVVYLLVEPKGGKKIITVLRHELVHVLLGKNITSGKIPRWFEEGTAMMFARENFSDYITVLSRANLTKSLLSLEEVDDVLKFQRSKASLAYAESYLGLKMIVEALGWEVFSEVFFSLQHEQNWDSVFQSVLKMDEDQFQWRLFDQIEKKYKWQFFFQAETFIWIILPFFTIIIFVIIRFRNYQTYRRWEEENEELSQNFNIDE